MSFKCPYCARVYNRLDFLRVHVRREHASRCQICGYKGKISTHALMMCDESHRLYAFLLLAARTVKRRYNCSDMMQKCFA